MTISGQVQLSESMVSFDIDVDADDLAPGKPTAQSPSNSAPAASR
jgi:hypothetical protein